MLVKHLQALVLPAGFAAVCCDSLSGLWAAAAGLDGTEHQEPVEQRLSSLWDRLLSLPLLELGPECSLSQLASYATQACSPVTFSS